jgi:hypothetical protein
MKSFKELYTKRRSKEKNHINKTGDGIETEFEVDKNIFGTMLAVSTSVWELCLTSKFIWTWFIGVVTDGYWMTLTAPFAWVFWLLASVFYLPLFVILSIFVALSVVWMYTFELTGSIVNKEKINDYKIRLFITLLCTIPVSLIILGITLQITLLWAIPVGIIVLCFFVWGVNVGLME